MLFVDHIENRLFAEPAMALDANELYILTGYATANMASRLIKAMLSLRKNLRIRLIIGMTPSDGISRNEHREFNDLMGIEQNFSCSYVYQGSPVHSKLYIWAKDGHPKRAYIGSANFTQPALVGGFQRETMSETDPTAAFEYFMVIDRDSIFCNSAEVEQFVNIHSDNIPHLDENGAFIAGERIDESKVVTLSFLTTRTGEPGRKSGLNWGQRPGREPNQAYIPLPSAVKRSGFFPLEKQHFVAITDDHFRLILRVEQENDKAITTPLNNSQIGEYFRRRLGLANGAFVSRDDLIRYGRTDVTFIKLDDELFYMDFSRPET